MWLITVSVSVFSFVAIIGTARHSNYNKINGLYRERSQVKTTRSHIVCADTTEEISFFDASS